MKYPCALLSACLLATTPAGATSMSFDFGNNSLTTPDVGWNNVIHDNGVPAPTLLNIVDETDTLVPGVTLEITDQFFTLGQPSMLGTESPSGDAAGFPVTATDDYFFGHTGPFAGGESNPVGAFKLTGLNPNYTYDFAFFSSRVGVGDNRETAFVVTGSNAANGTLATSNNDSQVLNLDDISPNRSNEINIQVSAGPNNDNGNSFYYINLMRVDVTVPEPTSLALLGLGGLLLARRRRG